MDWHPATVVAASVTAAAVAATAASDTARIERLRLLYHLLLLLLLRDVLLPEDPTLDRGRVAAPSSDPIKSVADMVLGWCAE